jgi:hypothetical protein
MVCPCGCARRDVSRLTRRRAIGLARSRYRSIGQSASEIAAAVHFNAADYVPPELVDDANTARGYYDQFANAAQGVSVVNGRVELSDGASEAVLGGIEAGITAIAPPLGAALGLFLALAPKAGPGPGVCATDPPAGPLLSQLQAWPHFTSWASFFSSYPVGSPGSFEAFANPPLEYNWLLFANCYSNKWLPPALLLATLVAAWNGVHQATSTRTICRSGLNPSGFGLGPGYDPIANALETAIQAGCPAPPGATFEQVVNAPPCEPQNATSCFQVNSGPLIVKRIPLRLHMTPAQAGLVAATSKPISTETAAQAAAIPTGLVVAGGLAAAAWYWRKPLARMLGIRL